MPIDDAIDLIFPMGGLVRAAGYQRQPPYTAPNCLNVRPREAASGRLRGGSRPMLSKAFLTQIGSGNPVLMLNSVRVASSSDAATYIEPFDGSSLSSDWGSQLGPGSAITIGGGVAIYSGGALYAGYKHTAISGFDDTEDWAFEIDVVPGNSIAYSIYFNSDNAANLNVGYKFFIRFASNYTTTGNYDTGYTLDNGTEAYITQVDGSIGAAGTFRVVIDAGVGIASYWRGVAGKTSATHVYTPGTNTRFGFAMNNLSGGGARMNEFRFYYTAVTAIGSRAVLVASSNGNLYVENALGGLTAVSASLNTSHHIASAEHLGKLYIADNVGTSNAGYRKFTYPSTEAAWTASPGTLPSSCTLICMYRGRIVLSGDGTSAIYMSRQDDPLDWDYGADLDDPGRAVATTSTNVSKIGEQPTALIPFANDYLMIGCADSIYLLAGDLALAGSEFVNQSRTIGIVGSEAWCITPDNQVVFMSRYGIYLAAVGSGALALSQPVLPRELQNIDPSQYSVQLEFDLYDGGVHIFLTPLSGGTATHWFMQWSDKSFWPVTYQATHQPTALYAYDSLPSSGSKVLIGGSDGYIRRHDDNAGTDDGSQVSSYVDYGPIRLGDLMHDGVCDALQCVLGENSGSVSCEVRPAQTAVESLTATAKATATFAAGRNRLARMRIRGQSATIRLSSTAVWSIEELALARTMRGRTRT